MDGRPGSDRGRVVFLVVLGVGSALLTLIVAGLLRSGGTDGNASRGTPIPAVALASQKFLHCTDCHGDLDRIFNEGRLPNLLFTHAKHFGVGVSDCAACHVANTHEPDRINRPTMVQCYMCHGLEEGASAPGQCSTCHPPQMPREPDTHLEANWVPVQHARLAKADNFDCMTCHRQSSCDSCHGLTLPHPDDWARALHPTAYFDDPALCQSCHPASEPRSRDFCDTCHHRQGPNDVPWLTYHPTAVQELTTTTCFQCHDSQTCVTCHRRGVLNLHADERQYLASPGPSTGSA